ncbi:hypothetical protein SBA4_3860003 [Candidatus Sulfopaludibacter sp. SbA4]|nr:hypothetical protein SBA4_3860003 [Candidatus Sulfopaludibacter sp. SbA4]
MGSNMRRIVSLHAARKNVKAGACKFNPAKGNLARRLSFRQAVHRGLTLKIEFLQRHGCLLPVSRNLFFVALCGPVKIANGRWRHPSALRMALEWPPEGTWDGKS